MGMATQCNRDTGTFRVDIELKPGIPGELMVDYI